MALTMGLIGGLFPAVRAVRIPIISALRELSAATTQIRIPMSKSETSTKSVTTKEPTDAAAEPFDESGRSSTISFAKHRDNGRIRDRAGSFTRTAKRDLAKSAAQACAHRTANC